MSETLVVVSKVKAFIKKQSEMNTSTSVMPILTKIVEEACTKAIESARREGRKTVMERDFPSNI
jgi:histone H3/H4